MKYIFFLLAHRSLLVPAFAQRDGQHDFDFEIGNVENALAAFAASFEWLDNVGGV